MRIVFTGGGTGGHLFPILAVARKIRELAPNGEEADFLFIGPCSDFEQEILSKEELIPCKKIVSGKLRRYFSLNYLLDIFFVPIGIAQALCALLRFMPDVVFAKGGHASFPVSFAAWIYRIPIIIHESDIVPGIANQVMGRFAKRIAVSFPSTAEFFPEGKVAVTGNPVRAEILNGSRDAAVKALQLDPEKPVILVIGGSQGSRSINSAIISILPELLKKWQIIHITGQKDFEAVLHAARERGIKENREGYFPFAFLKNELADMFAVCDLVISRAGANAMAEIAAIGKPSIFIPIKKSANNHQELNAFAFSQVNAGIVLDESNMGRNILLENISEAMENKSLRFEMSERIKKFHNPQAAELLAGEIINLAR